MLRRRPARRSTPRRSRARGRSPRPRRRRRTCGSARPGRWRRFPVELAERLVERVERPPPRRVIGDGPTEVLEVDRAERHRDDDVGRQHEQERQPDTPGAVNDGQYQRGYQTPLRLLRRRVAAPPRRRREVATSVSGRRARSISGTRLDLGPGVLPELIVPPAASSIRRQVRLEHVLGHDRHRAGSAARRPSSISVSGSIEVNGGW